MQLLATILTALCLSQAPVTEEIPTAQVIPSFQVTDIGIIGIPGPNPNATYATIRTSEGKSIAICFDRREESPTRFQMFTGAIHPELPTAEISSNEFRRSLAPKLENFLQTALRTPPPSNSRLHMKKRADQASLLKILQQHLRTYPLDSP